MNHSFNRIGLFVIVLPWTLGADARTRLTG